MNKRLIGRGVGASLALALILGGNQAQAYDWKTHVRMLEVAAQAMQPAFNDPGAPPAGVDPALWSQYVREIRSGESRFGVLRSGLPNAGAENTNSCAYNAQDDMSQISADRIQDMTYLPIMGGNVLGGSAIEHGGQCSEVLIQPTCPNHPGANDNALRIGRVLGWQSAAGDDHEEDTTVWLRPSSSAGFGALNSISTQALNDVGGAMLLPFVCLVELFSGNSCDLSQAENLASDVNPVDHLEGLLPGFDSQQSYLYVGFWHFIDVADLSGGFYNPTRGMLYTDGGPFGVPGAVDVAIVALSDIIGLSLNAGASAGVTRYGQFDAVTRDRPQWQAQNIGRTEFSPVSKMAQFGWDQFASAPTTALPLTWPLHALGDAAEPQHVAGTTSYGHRPFEDEVDNLLDTRLMPPPATCTLSSVVDAGSNGVVDPGQTARILRIGFDFWSKYHRQFSPGNMPVQAMVSDLASQTLAIALAAEITHPLSVFNDALSVDYLLNQQNADAGYDGSAAPMKAMLEVGTGAIIAFLSGAAQSIIDPGANPKQECQPGSAFDFMVGACVPGFQSSSAFQDAGLTLVGTPDAGGAHPADAGAGAGGRADAGAPSACGNATPCSSGACSGPFQCLGGCCILPPL